MKMEKRKFRIGDFAQNLGVKNFVIRFWEKEFNIKPTRSEGGQRFYNEADYEKFKLIKELLYEKKFTLEGAKTEIKRISIEKSNNIIPSQKTSLSESENNKATNIEINQKLNELKNQLLKLRELL